MDNDRNRRIPNMLCGNRIVLKPLSQADLDLADRMNQDSETMKFVGGLGTPRSRVEEFIQKQQEQFLCRGWGWMVIESQQGEKLGFVFLQPCSRLSEIELGYRICRDYWGQGYATESAQLLLSHGLKELHFNPIVAAVDPLNIASERVLQRIGMQYWKDVDWETTPSGFARCYKAS
ncbi:GNAT family N-acetyltransferase [Phormidium sp. FACHB-592]|uniref:GNAT family N-acetyltransferase n=1 Tax=Stenomitos frigidus AS-A4 TaxID=2933935 RepID=A0ABV0KU04_9CYAN|nr:GNAT family N-acetyltransferase [Phormidium sp. FACHB-592]MBD2077300.1 GNAT family N-acetyltransferase [Phormidium sp. FACHB-592]